MQLALQPVRILIDAVGFSGLNVRCERVAETRNCYYRVGCITNVAMC